MRKMLLGLALSLAPLPALADNTLLAGIDVWQTKNDSNTYVDLNLPAGFFCTTSAPFSGRIVLAGAPVATSPSGVLGATDTVVERLSNATFDASGVATVNAIVRAASFKSTAPITVSGCPGSTQWDVRSSAAPTQSPFPITIRRSGPTATGGSFDSSVTLSPRLTFTQQGSGLQRTLDQAAVTFTTSGAEWTHAPGSGVTYTGGPVQIDTDGDGATDTQVPPTSNFAPGWSRLPRTGCATPPCPVPIPHQAPSHFHYVSPPPPLRCTATAACSDGSSVSCQGSGTSCSAVDSNCSAGERGHVTCDGVTTSCPTACPACDCAALRADCAGACDPCPITFSCNAATCASSCRCRFQGCLQ